MSARGPRAPRPFHVCFVCSGNICRSPYAEAILRRLARESGLGDRVRASSLGTLGIEGSPAHEWTIRAAAERGEDLLPFRSRAIDPARAAEADLLVALAREHLGAVREVLARLPRPPPFWLITAPGLAEIPADREGIADPIGVEGEEYRRALAAIDAALPPLWAAIRKLIPVE